MKDQDSLQQFFPLWLHSQPNNREDNHENRSSQSKRTRPGSRLSFGLWKKGKKRRLRQRKRTFDLKLAIPENNEVRIRLLRSRKAALHDANPAGADDLDRAAAIAKDGPKKKRLTFPFQNPNSIGTILKERVIN
jgi:hypothetical protein